MPPLDRRRRRRRAMPAVLLVLAVVVVVLVGGAVDIGPASGPYRRDVNRSYVAQGTILVGQSDRTGAELRRLMGRMATLGRTTLRQDLDDLASASAGVAASAAALSPPAPTVDGFATSLAARAKGVADVRAAVDGLLGLGRGGRALLPPDRAAAQVAAAGRLLAQADRTYAAVRRRFRAAPGAASLPRSTWVTDPQIWAPGPVQTLVQALAGSATLAPVRRVVLRPDTVRIVPAAVPPVRPGGPSVVLPTRTLQVSAVVADEGNVAAPGATVSATVTPQGAGAPDRSARQVSLPPGGAVAVTLPKLRVVPGHTYTLTVSVGQISETFAVRVALPTPTTTVPPTTSTGRSATS